MEELVDKKVGLSGAGTCTHVNNLGVAKDGVLLLVGKAVQFVGIGATYESHRSLIGKNISCQVNQPYNHAVEGNIRGFVNGHVVMHNVIKFIFQAECGLRYLIVLTPFIEFLESVGKCAISARYLIIEIMRYRPHGFCLIRPITIWLQIVILKHLVEFLYPFFSHGCVLQFVAKFGFASRGYFCSV